MQRSGAVLATVLAAGWMLTGCGQGGSDEAGFGLGTLTTQDGRAVLEGAGATAGPLQGTLRVRDDGCFTWVGKPGDGAWIVWPDSAEPDREDGGRVVLNDGQVVSDGTTLSAEGALIALADLPGGADADSYFGSYGGFCDADTEGVMLLTRVAPG